MTLNYYTIRTVSTGTVAAGNADLWSVNINTGATGAILKIYDGTSSGGTLVATIDASTKSSHGFGVRCHNGIFVDLSVGNADCTIGYR